MKMTIPITTTYTILIIERGKLRLAFVSTEAVLVRKSRCTLGAHKISLPQWGKVAAAMFAKQTCHGAKRNRKADG